MFTQFPLCLAWAITIHMSQGQTYKTVAVDFGRGALTHGQAYAALSRCESLDGLHLVEPLKKSNIIVDSSAEDFIAKHKAPIPMHLQKENVIELIIRIKRSGTAVLISCSKLKRTYACEAELLYAQAVCSINRLPAPNHFK